MLTVKLHLIFLLLIFSCLQAFGAPNKSEFKQSLVDNLFRVAEFKKISEISEDLGLHVWIWAGISSGYGEYNKRAYLKAKGVEKYQKLNFSFAMSEIFPYGSDIDLVVDGTPEQTEILKEALVKKLGRKYIWDIRPLKYKVSNPKALFVKEALLNNSEFMDQHNDSASLGFIELTTPQSKEPRIRDLKNWNSDDNDFVNDLIEGQIRYYYSDRHRQTSRAANGDNPEIFSVIRILIKSFQLDRTITPKSLSDIRKVIAETNPASLTEQNRRWIERKAIKLLSTALDLTRASETIDELGLRELLLRISPASHIPGTLGWWMNRKVLPRFEVGLGSSPTAAELKIKQISHDTRSVQDFWSIVRNPDGKINAFVSRDCVATEAAYYGEGFYAMIGSAGNKNNGLAVQLSLRPDARLGSDFVIDNSDGHIRILNGNAVTWEPERQSLSGAQYFRIMSGIDKSADLDSSLQPVIRVLIARMQDYRFSQEDLDEIAVFFDGLLQNKARSLSVEEQASNLIRLINTFSSEDGFSLQTVVIQVLKQTSFLAEHPSLLKNESLVKMLLPLLSGEVGVKTLALMFAQNSRVEFSKIQVAVMLQNEILSDKWLEYPMFLESLLSVLEIQNQNLIDRRFIVKLLKSENALAYKALIKRALDKTSEADYKIFGYEVSRLIQSKSDLFSQADVDAILLRSKSSIDKQIHNEIFSPRTPQRPKSSNFWYTSRTPQDKCFTLFSQ